MQQLVSGKECTCVDNPVHISLPSQENCTTRLARARKTILVAESGFTKHPCLYTKPQVLTVESNADTGEIGVQLPKHSEHLYRHS